MRGAVKKESSPQNNMNLLYFSLQCPLPACGMGGGGGIFVGEPPSYYK